MKRAQKKVEARGFKTLIDNPQGLQQVLDTIVCGVIIIDRQGRIIYSNDSARRILGVSREELIGHPFHHPNWQLYDSGGDPVPSDALPFARALRQGETVRGEIYALENGAHERRYISVNVVPLHEEDTIIGAAADFIDISGDVRRQTEREKMLATLRASENRYRQLTESAPLGVFECDGEGCWIYVNPRWSAISGRTRKESLEFGWTASIHPDDRDGVRREWRLSSRNPKTWQCEFRIVRPDGRTVWVRALKGPVAFDGEGGTHFVGTLEDITASKETELALRRAKTAAEEASQSKSRFLATVSHEIRTPMTVFMGMVELALSGNLDPEPRSYLETALSSADALLLLIEEILEFSELEADTFVLRQERFHLGRCVREAIAPFMEKAREKGIDLRLALAPDVPTRVTGDARRLHCILRNLVGNAVKFTQKGWIEVEVACCLECIPGREAILFSVRDSGIGVPSEKMHLLFHPFSQVDPSSTRTYGGAGLGLAISKGIIERMGGAIRVESTPGAGSHFSFYLPLDSG